MCFLRERETASWPHDSRLPNISVFLSMKSFHCGPSLVLEFTELPSGFCLPVIEEQQDNVYQVQSLSGCTFFFFLCCTTREILVP